MRDSCLLLLLFGEARFSKLLVELVDTAGCIHKLHLTGEERVRGIRNFQLYQRVFVAIFPNDGILGWSAGAGDERLITGEVLEHNQTIILRMNILFHIRMLFLSLNGTAKVGVLSGKRKPYE